MKSFRISVIILIFMILLIVCDIFYSIKVTDTLEKMLFENDILSDNETAPEVKTGTVDKAIGYWKKCEPVMHLGTDTEYTDRITEKLLYLREAVNSEEAFEIDQTLSDLRFYIGSLRRMNSISWKNIF